MSSLEFQSHFRDLHIRKTGMHLPNAHLLSSLRCPWTTSTLTQPQTL